ncbi:hypothetical protein ACFQNJ_07360 [Hydrogenophaga bisanensis]|uniref:Uncharacterized protein n=1 Tax=Hydrogenophaga bisanensis TaxID=439611 RepID=A0ABW2R8D6_9BURK
MKVIIKIGDREAVPVRAIPLLTHWETMSPDVVAQALAWNEGEPHFKGLQAFRCYEGSRPIPAREWENEVCWQFTALNESMKATGNTPATGLLEWRRRALEILPAGVYVWKDEFEPMHCMRYGPDGETLLKNMVPVDDEAHERLVALDFDPVISDPEIQRLVFEGFVPTPAGDAAFTLAFYGTCGGLDIEQWAKKMEVRPLEAARLLCGEDPLNLKACADSAEVQLLARILEDTAKSHPDGCMLRDYALLAMERGARHRQEISMAVVHLTADAVTAVQSATLVPNEASNTAVHNRSMLASRDQLIAAFGSFTGMDSTWFNNLTDTPALQASRKVAGQGMRGRTAEPLFCPFEVMQWLANPKRRKGRKLSPDKAWELLERHFPKVYNLKSVADPRSPD